MTTIKASEQIFQQANANLNKSVFGNAYFWVTAYGAKGDGITDNTLSIQATIDAAFNAGGGIVFFPKGTFIVSAHLVMKSNVVLQGVGVSSIIKRSAGAAANDFILINANTGGAIGVYTDSYMELHDLVFDGNNIANCTIPLLNFIKAKYILMDNIIVQNHTHIGIDVAGCYQASIIHSRFFNNGRPKPSTISAPAIHVYNNPGDNTKCLYVHVEDCHFENNQWSGAYFMPEEGHIIDCTLINNGESSIYSGGGKNIKFIGNYIYGARMSNISASGIEIGGMDYVIADNHIYNCQAGGIAVTDSQRIIIENNIIKNNGLNPASGSGLTIITTSVAPNQPQHIVVRGNVITDDQPTKTQAYGIQFGTYAAASPDYIQIEGNDLAGNATSAILMDATWGPNCFTANNLGHASATPYVGTLTVPAAIGNLSVTGIGFRPRLIVMSGVEISGSAANHFQSMVTAASSQCQIDSATTTAATATFTAKAITLFSAAGALVTEATLVSMDKDGFTLNFTNVTTKPAVMFTAYP